MMRNFPLFQSHLDLAHNYWDRLLQNGDWAIDATCGGGNDSLFLAAIVEKKGSGEVIAIDIQEEAVTRTKERIPAALIPKVHLFNQSHENFPALSSEMPIKLVVYNLGYLPKGNKQLTTQTSTTLQSVQKALDLILPGGGVSITCYPGHPEGATEEKALIEMLTQLPSSHWNVCFHTFPNRKAAPSLILIQKNTLMGSNT